jgi:hypothetical protein
MNGGALEYLYEDAEEEEKPKLYKELASYVLGYKQGRPRTLATSS